MLNYKKQQQTNKQKTLSLVFFSPFLLYSELPDLKLPSSIVCRESWRSICTTIAAFVWTTLSGRRRRRKKENKTKLLFQRKVTLRAEVSLLLAFMKPSATRRLVVGLFYKPTTRLTSVANDLVNAKSHAREKPLLAEYLNIWFLTLLNII